MANKSFNTKTENNNRNTVLESFRNGSASRSRADTESWASDLTVVPSMSSLSLVTNASPPRDQQIYLQTTQRRAENDAQGGSQKQHAKLVYHTSFGGKMYFSLVDDKTFIGRKDDNQIQLKRCPKISKQHAMVERIDDRYYLRDRKSSNGVKLNGHYIDPDAPKLLNDGDHILIGSIELVFYEQVTRRPSSCENDHLKLVTILPSEQKYEEAVTIRTEIEADELDFKKVSQVDSVSVLREDYEKLRLAYELSKFSLTSDITSLLEKSLDMMFEILPVDRGVVLLVDQTTGYLGPHHVKLREGKSNEGREICLSSHHHQQDPQLSQAASVRHGQIRSVICVPLIAHNKVHGILHLDSRERYSFSPKDLSLVKAISNQTAMAIENNILIKEVENKAKITEQLSRFLAPHVVDKMVNKTEIIKKGGRLINGTIIFADIRGFTNISEKAGGPGEVVDLLNDYFERLVRSVFKYDGVVDKYIGDALMAVFGTLEDEVDPEFRAVSAALDFVNEVTEMNHERKKIGQPPITIGVGVNTGELVAGFIGCSQRLEYTCIGDTVNTSSRICDGAEPNQVLISESTYEKVKSRVNAVDAGGRKFKGKQHLVKVYEALGLTDGGARAAKQFSNNAKTIKY